MGDFDLDRYIRVSGKLDLSAFDWDAVGDHPLPADEARCLRYMMDIESHTAIYLRDLLATPAANDPEVTAFLSCWAFEEMWHGEALSRFLRAADVEVGPPGDTPAVANVATAPLPTRRARNAGIRRRYGSGSSLNHLATVLASAVVGPDFVAVHMTWGAVNELSTLAGYERLVARTQHPVLKSLLTRIVKDERRHFAFYRSQARMRLAASPRARRITRWALQHLWAPVGTGVTPQAETDYVVLTLFGDSEGRRAIEQLDSTVAALPGLDGLDIVTRARRAAIARTHTRRRPGRLTPGVVGA